MDLKFSEIVDSDGMRGVQPDLHYRSLCTECGTYAEVYRREWRHPVLVDEDEMKYVADMRAWLCCHEDEEPLDGFPDDPRE